MAYSLLAHLYPYIKGSQEDIATYSLQYLLSNSDELNRTFTKLLSTKMEVELEENLQYSCQVTGKSEEKERPDMAGFSSQSTESVLCEMKFYATLTSNQPGTYLDRLRKNNGKGLMFVCPSARRTSLWAKLRSLCNDEIILDINPYCIDVSGIRMSIMTWTEIIELLKQVAAATDVFLLPDIAQLEGYCNKLDSDAFVPFSARDLSANVARTIDRYYQVVDEVIDLLEADMTLETSRKGTKATAYRKGYARSLAINQYTITLNFDWELWNNPALLETPFWIAIKNEEWKQPEQIQEVFKMVSEHKRVQHWGVYYMALEPMQDATLSEVCEDLKIQIMKYLALL